MIANIISTHQCNLRCKHCYYINNLQPEDSDNALKNWDLLLQMSDKIDIEKFNFSGGEASISRNITELLSDCRNRDIPFSLFSNGISVSEQIIDTCNEYHLSIDGVGLIHDKIRSFDGAFKRMSILLDMLKARHKTVHIQTTINKININELSPLLQLYSEYASIIKSISLVGVINQGNSLKYNISLSDEDYFTIKAFKERILDLLHYHVFVKDNIYTYSQIEEFVLSPKSVFPLWIDLISGEAYVMNENYKTPLRNLSQDWLQEQYNLIRSTIQNHISMSNNKFYILEELVD